MTATGYFTHEACTLHDMGAGHPEQPARLAAIASELQASELWVRLSHMVAPCATRDQLARAHTAAHLDTVFQAAQMLEQGKASLVPLDADTVMNAASHEAALRAAGAGIAAVDAVMRGDLNNAFCAVRPPGHHATRSQAMGFCIYSNAAVAAKHAVAAHGLKRVAVIDFDVHHGNGTADVVQGDPALFMTGFFQHPFYPYTGSEAEGKNVLNVPIPAYTRGMAIRQIFAHDVVGALDGFKPQLIIISAGFDAHREDPLGQLGLTDSDYGWMTEQILAVAKRHAQGRVVSMLEGGYGLNALSRSVREHVQALLAA
jgi:acetoin utilization deacetylase AcuC-like enzyme